jgi:conjugal transfer ATP-binding protein TraC
VIATIRRLRPRADASTGSLLPVDALVGSAMRLRGGGSRAVLECPTLAFGIKGEAEQRAVLDGWSALLNSLGYPLQVVIRTRSIDRTRVAGADSPSADVSNALRTAYAKLIERLANARQIVDRRYFVVVPWDPEPTRRGRDVAGGLEALEQRTRWVEECLRRIDLAPRRLSDLELADVLRSSLDPNASLQPIGADDALGEVGALIAPAGFAEHAGSLEIGARRARTVVVVRYPSQLHAGWLGDLAALESDLDVALHIAPSAGVAAMAFLERRVAELSSTVRVSEERGSRTDPYRRLALGDALALRDQLAQGTERLFDTVLAFTVWADSDAELDARTLGLEALLGTRLVHTRRLAFEMRAGLLSTLPLCRPAIGVRRVLSTAALAATFPFSGGDLRSRDGLLYGINTQTRSAVVLDRFALENHNAVVFATSGAGKSYLVKVELARAVLAGARCVVIDPEGEYASLVGELGGDVVTLRPGGATGLDAFAVADGAPGTLATRIATLGTLIALLVGGLDGNERAAVDDALCLAYEQLGFGDGDSVAGLRPPKLSTIQMHLRTRPDLARVVAQLERYVTGSSSWLFGATDSPSMASGNHVVYTLAGLPEEERAPAMFLVLDRIWTSLARSTRPTFVVVDEAWWLMRRPETAAFLYRLVKTARKRRAGLTLITQDVSDVLAHPDGEALVTNSAVQILMKQAPQALPRLAELFRLTQAEQSFLLSAQQGEALFVAQGRRVPLRVVATDEEARLIEGRASSA